MQTRKFRIWVFCFFLTFEMFSLLLALPPSPGVEPSKSYYVHNFLMINQGPAGLLLSAIRYSSPIWYFFSTLLFINALLFVPSFFTRRIWALVCLAVGLAAWLFFGFLNAGFFYF
jgi:hypothetical protein